MDTSALTGYLVIGLITFIVFYYPLKWIGEFFRFILRRKEKADSTSEKEITQNSNTIESEYTVSSSPGGLMMYLFAVVFRLIWSLTIGLVFFLVGLVLFILLDILMPNSNKGYIVLNNMYKWGSCYWFKGLRMETDDFDVDVSKKRKS